MITVLHRPGHVPDAGIVIADAAQLEALLRDRRLERDWTTTTAAGLAGLSRHAVMDLEHPDRTTKLGTATRYAAAMGVRLVVRVPAGGQPAAGARRSPVLEGINPLIAALARRRRTLGYTQESLGLRLGRSSMSIKRWEAGTFQPTVEDTIRYAYAVQARIVLRPTAPTGGTR